jgi:glycine cleavage system T protein (aminomethyltransferase)
MQASRVPLKRSPLHDLSRELGARFVEFSGWEMPVQFTSVLEEHAAVRGAAGLFDVSHMGEIAIRGRDALAVVQRLTSNDAARLTTGGAQYSALLTESGGFVDDIVVYRRAADELLLVVNAGNTEKDFAWIAARASGEVEIVNASARYAQLAIQGPRAEAILQECTRMDLRSIRYYRFAEGEVRSAGALVSRTGYTGEDGFEVYLPPDRAADLVRALLQAGGARGLRLCGLGARDTLRLEAGMPLYGNDIDEATTVIEAGLDGILKLDKGEFVGREALRRQKADGPERRLAGFELTDPGIARHGFPVRDEAGREVGRVTSGTLGPTLKKSIGLAYVPARASAAGSRLTVAIREREAGMVIVPIPFYRRPR